MKGKRLNTGEFADYYTEYIEMVPDGDIIDILKNQIYSTIALLETMSEQQGEYRYASGKWSVKEVLGHMADTERVMAYRMLAIGRGDTVCLPGMDEDNYVREAGFNRQKVSDLRENLLAVRNATVHLMKSLDRKAWDRIGMANDTAVSVNALAYIIAGHELHHRSILSGRYFSAETYPRETRE